MEQFLHDTIRAAGELAVTYFDAELNISHKTNQFDLLTEADTTTNKFITDRIKEAYPNHAIKSEEEGYHSNDSEYEWLVDPIDGTWNFAHKYPVWGVMMCLLKNGETILSAVYFPITKQLFHANASGAFLQGNPIQIPPNTHSLEVAVGKVGGSAKKEKKTYHAYKKLWAKIVSKSQSQIRTSGAACELVYMLTGNIHYAASNGGADHDHLPTLYILKQAGAVISNHMGEPYERGNEGYVIASTPALHAEIVALFDAE